MTTINYRKTPGCIYKIDIAPTMIAAYVQIPDLLGLKFADDQREKLTADIHDALETVLAPFFKDVKGVIKVGDEVVAQITSPVTFTPPEKATQGWGLPFNSRKAHYFNNSITSLCGKWAFGGELEDKNHEHPENCAACMKKRVKL
jgi:hypothetical protein